MNVREKKSHPRGRPLQLRYPNEPHHRRFADDSLAAKKLQASNVIRLEIERVKQGGKRARALAATSAPPISSAGFHAVQILARLICFSCRVFGSVETTQHDL